MTLKCLLVDDEPPALQVLENYVSGVPQLELVGSCNNAFRAMEVLQKKKVDLLFIDIQMPKLTGISLVKTLKHPPKVIFTTAFKEYAVEAFDVDAVDYLLKPVSFERFLKAVNKVLHQNGSEVKEEEEAINGTGGFLYFRADRKMIKVFLEEVLYVESLKDYVKIYRMNDKPLVVKQSISALEAMLPQNQFVRIHRSFIVSVNKITAFTSHDVEIGTIELPIGRLYSCNVQKLSL
jgi:two-component system, LytTR family, response regulator